MSDNIGILGAGGQADEAESFLPDGVEAGFKAVTSDYVSGDLVDIEKPDPSLIEKPVIAAIGAPYVRRTLIDKWPGKKYAKVISKNSSVSKTASVGDGCIIAPGAVITTNVEIGPHTIVNIGATISHNCKLGAYSTVSPGASLAGNVSLGDGVFVGMGAMIINGVQIAKGVVIGAGAVVIHDITEENAVFAGVPAAKIGQHEDWLEKV